ncbi:MAG: acetyltransferase [Bryobacteraceae bacterium]
MYGRKQYLLGGFLFNGGRGWSVFLRLAGAAVAVALAAPLAAQSLLGVPGAQVHVVGSDLAVLEAQDVRKEIECTVTPEKPTLGFDLRFHLGFTVNVPLRDIAGETNMLNVLFRVTPTSKKSEPHYFIQHFTVPKIEEDAKGDAVLDGIIDLGEGEYHVDWMMRDRTESVCSFYWDAKAELPNKDKDMHLEIASGVIEAAHLEQFTEEPDVSRRIESLPLKIKVLVNFAPQNASASTMRPQDTIALATILRQIARQPEFGKFSVVAFNIQEQRVLYRQELDNQIDFPGLGEALKSIKLGVVDTRRLQQKHGDTEFLTDLIQTEMMADDHPDALIFAGPKIMLDQSVPEDTLKPLAGIDYPVFYMNYALNPAAVPWRDSIGRVIRVFRGTEFTISRPRDLWFSMTDMVSRIMKAQRGKGSPDSTR